MHGYYSNKDDIQKRLRRAEGQVRGIARMVDEDAYCIDILTQISAIEAALDKVALELLREHAHHCLVNDAVGPGSRAEKADELVAAIGRFMKK